MLTIVLFILLSLSTQSVCADKPEYVFKSTSTMNMGVTQSTYSQRRTIIYDDEDDYYDDEDDGEIIGPGYNPAEPATPIGDPLIPLFVILFSYLLFSKKYIKKNKENSIIFR